MRKFISLGVCLLLANFSAFAGGPMSAFLGDIRLTSPDLAVIDLTGKGSPLNRKLCSGMSSHVHSKI